MILRVKRSRHPARVHLPSYEVRPARGRAALEWLSTRLAWVVDYRVAPFVGSRMEPS